MSVSQPMGGMNGPSMRLPLLSSGDQNGNAFPVSSSSSSFSSPDSLRSLSSLSGGRTESPLDVDMECVMTTKMDAALLAREPPRTAFSESNDNSVSVYVDADEDTWNDNLTLAGIREHSIGVHADHPYEVTSVASSGRRDSAPDSEATEIPGDEDDEEGLFLSVSSDVAIRRTSLSESQQLPGSAGSFLEDLTPAAASLRAHHAATLPDLCEGLQGRKSPHAGPHSLENRGSCSPGLSGVEVLWVGVDLTKEDCPQGVLAVGEAAETKSGARQSSKVVELAVPPFIAPQSPNEGTEGQSVALRKTKGYSGATQSKPHPTVAKATIVATPKLGKTDIKRFPKPDLKNVKSKIMSRPAIAPRTANRMQGKAALANEKSTSDGLQRKRSSLGQKAILKPGLRPNQNTGPRVSNHSQKRRRGTVASGIRSASSSSLGSEVTADGPQRTRRGADQDVPVPAGATKDHTQDETPAKLRRSSGNKVSSKLGPSSARQLPQPRGRGAGGASRAVGNSLSSTSPASAEGSPGSRLPPPTPPATGKDVQTTGSGSPPRGRPTQLVGVPKSRVADRPSGLAAPTVVTPQPKPSLNLGTGAPRPAAAASKLPVKNLPTSVSSSTLGSDCSGAIAAPSKAPEVVVAGGCKPEERPSRHAVPLVNQLTVKAPCTNTKAPGFRSRAPSLPGRSTATGLRTPTVSAQVAGKPAQTPLQRAGSARLNRPAAAATVDKNKTRGAPRAPPQTGSTAHSGGPNQLPQPDLVPAVPVPMPPRPALVEDKPAAAAQNQWEKKNQCVQQLRRLLAQGNRRIEALATVVQHLFSEREDALKLKKGLSLELANLRDELVSSSQCCERLQKEKEEVHASLEEAVGRLQEEHQAELTGLEERLRAFYQAEWDKVHQAYQEEADKCRALMEQQLEEMRCRQEALRKEQEASHAQQMDNLKLTYNTSVQGHLKLELRRTQEQDLENLDKTLKETEATLNEKIQDLTSENEVLSEKLRAEEERRILAEKNQKDSHVLYLQQELESLKVVLEIKTTQLHQQDKKLMQMDKLVEANVKLEERLNKVQQENEDYRARMDKHTALSRQLSSEQAVLQQTLQKESKVNKRLSMENEELLWKLHNGDLASPRRLSPSSPFHSPRNSASFPNTAAPLSPTR
ncbi:microtubule-associated tumor suppressor 1 homolog isoform X2 [Esox lucius]|uniref:microtubule-associated tumor suppressor 1 homolog isoform X2 n=1 Tax=Esox lucius TaxID=8010 RepID=UPI00147710FC|nr:microtubule-associated tumor suppressor 1 homolog isoform X2 [Esox lucius]